MPSSVLDAFDELDLVAIELPFASRSITVSQTWHKRKTADAAHQRLREQVRTVAHQLRPTG